MRNGKNIGTFLYWGHTTVTTRCGAVVGSVLRGSVLCRKRGRRITENIRVEVDGGGAVVFKWSVEHGSSIIHGLETSSTSIPLPPRYASARARAPTVFLSV